jgi:hypothetical protein
MLVIHAYLAAVAVALVATFIPILRGIRADMVVLETARPRGTRKAA